MIADAQPYLMDVFRERFQPQQLRGKSKHTASLHKTTIEWFEESLGRRATILDLTDENAASFFYWIESNPGPRGTIRDARTINNRRSYFFAFWRWCARKGIARTWPDVPPLPEPEKNPEAWRVAELKQLFRACRQAGNKRVKGVQSDIPAKHWWLAMHYIWWDTGERTSATLAIETQWVNLETRVLHVPARVRKGKKKAMTYTLKPRTIEAIKKILNPPRKMLFDFGQCIDTFYERYEKLLKNAGLPFDRKCKPQKMRRSFATHLEDLGGDATKALGHSSRGITKKSYLDKTIIREDSPNSILFDL